MAASRYAPDTLPPPPRWHSQAACLDEDPELFFPDPGDMGKAAEAKRICHRCPVIDDCLKEAMGVEGSTARQSRYGIYGGLSANARRALYERSVQAGIEAAA
jgi:WhiB family redox-sensing transcriptional regulator